MNATGSSSAINHCLSLLSPYSKQLTDIILNITKQYCSTDETLEVIGLYHDDRAIFTLYHSSGGKLSSEAARLLFYSLLSGNCKLHTLSLHHCTVSTTDHIYQFYFFELQQANAKVSLNATGFSSAINHCLSLLSPYSKLLTDIILNIRKQFYSTDETLEGIGLYHDEQSNLHTLSFKGGKLSSEATSSLIQSLLSPHCKLHKLSIRDCTVCTSDRTYQFSSFELQKAYANVSLNATGSCSAINHCLSLLSPYSNQLTDIILNITKQYCSTDETLERIGLYHDEQSNIHTLSFKGGKLSSEATSSLIQSLISPHCKLHTLSMRDCTVCTSDGTYQFSSFELQQAYAKVSLNATGFSPAINHCLSLLSPYSNQLTDIILNITKQYCSTDETLERIGLYHDEQSNIHTLSFKGGKLSSEATSSLIQSLISPHCKLHTLSMRDCTVCTSDGTYQFSSFELQQAYAKVSLNATGSSSAINHCLSLLSPYSNQLTVIISRLYQSIGFE